MIYETIVKYDEEGKQILINRIKSSSCYFLGFFIIVSSIFGLITFESYKASINEDLKKFLPIILLLNLLFIAPLTFIYPTVREFTDGKDSIKNFFLTNIIASLIKIIIAILFSKQPKK